MRFEVVHSIRCLPAERARLHVGPGVGVLVAMEGLGGGIHLGAVGALIKLLV